MTRDRPRNGRDRRPRTISITLRDRGQTTQDFAVGIGVFILAVAFVFSFLPTVLTPFDSSASGGQTAQADRIADRVVHEFSDSDSNRPNEITWTEIDDEDLADELGLRTNEDGDPIDRVNVSLQDFDDDGPGETGFGSEYDNQSAASSARIVTVDSDPDGVECDPACRLVVRVW